jgi:hypothetical protein
LALPAALVAYAAVGLRQLEPVTAMFLGCCLLAGILLIVPSSFHPMRLVAIGTAYLIFVPGRIEVVRIALASAVALWVTATSIFAIRLAKANRDRLAAVVGSASDLWLIAMLTLLSLEGYIVTGLLLISAASWIPRAGKTKLWLVLAYALLGGWLIIAAKVDINLELRRWYLLGALALGIAGSLLVSAQEMQQRENVHPQ